MTYIGDLSPKEITYGGLQLEFDLSGGFSDTVANLWRCSSGVLAKTTMPSR